MLKKLAVAIGALSLAAGALTLGSPAQAQGVKAGAFTCNVAGGFGFIFGSSRSVNCTFAPVGGGPPQHYVGSIDKFGVDIGYIQGGVLIWAVFAPPTNIAPGSLAGNYGGATGSAMVGTVSTLVDRRSDYCQVRGGRIKIVSVLKRRTGLTLGPAPRRYDD